VLTGLAYNNRRLSNIRPINRIIGEKSIPPKGGTTLRIGRSNGSVRPLKSLAAG